MDEFLTDSLRLYCRQHDLPQLSGDELQHEIWAAMIKESRLILGRTFAELESFADFISAWLQEYQAAEPAAPKIRLESSCGGYHVLNIYTE